MSIRIRPTPRSLLSSGLVATIAMAGLASCNSNDETPLSLSPTGEAGHTLYLQSGCAGCHGKNGAGGAGPPLAGLYGTEVELTDGARLTADAAYLTKAIKDPQAERVKGYNLVMPGNNLSPEQIDSIIAFIEEIGPTAASTDRTNSGTDTP